MQATAIASKDLFPGAAISNCATAKTVPTPQGGDTGWNDDGEAPDDSAARAGVVQLARFYEPAAP